MNEQASDALTRLNASIQEHPEQIVKFKRNQSRENTEKMSKWI